jgi:hypothetical protein
MLSTQLEYPCAESECFVQGWNSFVQILNALYGVGMPSTGLECFRQCWNNFVQGWNAL